MDLKTERKIKFWLATLAKLAFFIWVVLKIYDFASSGKGKTEPGKTTDTTAGKDTIVQSGDTGKEVPIDKEPLSSTGTMIDELEKGEIASAGPNSISIIVYGDNGIDRQIAHHLESTLFQEYDVGILPFRAHDKKDELLRGNVSVLGEIKTQYITVGEVHYRFGKSSLSADAVSCQISLRFDTYHRPTHTKKRDFSKSIQANGVGFSREEAKANAIKKI